MEELLKLSDSRKGRLLVAILVPPLLGALAHAVIILGLLFVTEKGPVTEKIITASILIVLTVIWAYVIVGVQSLVAGLLMEYVVRRFATRKFHIVVTAAIMGLLSSVIYRTDSPLFLLLGFLIGSCLGLFLSHSFQAEQSGNDSG